MLVAAAVPHCYLVTCRPASLRVMAAPVSSCLATLQVAFQISAATSCRKTGHGSWHTTSWLEPSWRRVSKDGSSTQRFECQRSQHTHRGPTMCSTRHTWKHATYAYSMQHTCNMSMHVALCMHARCSMYATCSMHACMQHKLTTFMLQHTAHMQHATCNVHATYRCITTDADSANRLVALEDEHSTWDRHKPACILS